MWGPRESQGARSGPGSSAASLTLRLRLPRWTGCGRQDWHCQARVAITWGRELAFEVGTAPAWASLEAPTLLQLLSGCCSSYPAAAAPDHSGLVCFCLSGPGCVHVIRRLQPRPSPPAAVLGTGGQACGPAGLADDPPATAAGCSHLLVHRLGHGELALWTRAETAGASEAMGALARATGLLGPPHPVRVWTTFLSGLLFCTV